MSETLKAGDLNSSHLVKLLHVDGPKGISVTAPIVRVTHRRQPANRNVTVFVDLLVNGTEVEFEYNSEETVTVVAVE